MPVFVNLRTCAEADRIFEEAADLQYAGDIVRRHEFAHGFSP